MKERVRAASSRRPPIGREVGDALHGADGYDLVRSHGAHLTQPAIWTFGPVMTQRDVDIIASGYDHVADAYEALESPEAPWPRLKRVRAFAADLPEGSRVLDIGCGNGIPATRELAFKYAVTGVDISEEQIARARANVPAATFIRADARDADLPLGTFDAIVALYLIDNISRDDYPALFRRFRALLRPGGRVLLSAEPGNDPWQPFTWLGVPMFINTIPTDELVRLLQDAGLSVASVEFESQLEGGCPIEYAWIVGAKRQNDPLGADSPSRPLGPLLDSGPAPFDAAAKLKRCSRATSPERR